MWTERTKSTYLKIKIWNILRTEGARNKQAAHSKSALTNTLSPLNFDRRHFALLFSVIFEWTSKRVKLYRHSLCSQENLLLPTGFIFSLISITPPLKLLNRRLVPQHGQGLYTKRFTKGLRWVMILFVISEALIYFHLFWALLRWTNSWTWNFTDLQLSPFCVAHPLVDRKS
jgi:hypothetical protein